MYDTTCNITDNHSKTTYSKPPILTKTLTILIIWRYTYFIDIVRHPVNCLFSMIFWLFSLKVIATFSRGYRIYEVKMGVIVPPDDEEPPTCPYSCPLVGLDPMMTAVVQVSGIQCTGRMPNWGLNGTKYIPPFNPCAWEKLYIPSPSIVYKAQLQFGVGYSSFQMYLLDYPYYLFYRSLAYDIVYSGENQNSGYFYGGTHQVSFQYAGAPMSLADTAAALGINAKHKTFFEPAGQNPANSTVNQRFASQFDGTNVYIKRPTN